MAKLSIKSERITPFGGIYYVRELFSRYMAPIIDKEIMQRTKLQQMQHFATKQKETQSAYNYKIKTCNY